MSQNAADWIVTCIFRAGFVVLDLFIFWWLRHFLHDDHIALVVVISTSFAGLLVKRD